MDRSDKLLLSLVLLLLVVTFAATAWPFLYDKQYVFLVEAECNPATETCFYRDCSNPDDCPPNGLEEYKTYTVSANEFEMCTDNSCAAECASGVISCEEIVCGASEEDECALYEPEPEPLIEEESTEETDDGEVLIEERPYGL